LEARYFFQKPEGGGGETGEDATNMKDRGVYMTTECEKKETERRKRAGGQIKKRRYFSTPSGEAMIGQPSQVSEKKRNPVMCGQKKIQLKGRRPTYDWNLKETNVALK